MDYHKLLEDYLNKDNYRHQDHTVISFEDKGDRVKVYYRYDENTTQSDQTIYLFDLLTFVYSKLCQ